MLYKFNVEVVNDVEVLIKAENEDDAMKKFAIIKANFKLTEYDDYHSWITSQNLRVKMK
ncbi:hypothetical protein [Candidatus Methylopumilus planktonicus]|jgi:hypothetical protein|uniref:hypothetical protein n=1 Tax=Candidatus Methylopumilus planktonicus TaxID=1581557 RepID=UPI003BEEEFC6